MIQALHQLGVEAELSGRNDIVVDGRKISGNAQFATKGRIFSHGTLMFDSAIDHVVSALKVKKDKIESKGIKSIRSRVANISEFLDDKMTTEEFRSHLLRHIFNTNDVGNVPEYKLTEKIGRPFIKFRKSAIRIGIGTTAAHQNLTLIIRSVIRLDRSICTWKSRKAKSRTAKSSEISSVSVMYLKLKTCWSENNTNAASSLMCSKV